MYKLQTDLSNFKTKSSDCNFGPISITWSKLVQTDNTLDFICFSQDELIKLTNFVANNKFNLSNQNYFSCTKISEDWSVSVYKNFPDFIFEYLILSKEKLDSHIMEKHKNIGEIELLTFNGSKNNYSLDFNIIGKVEF